MLTVSPAVMVPPTVSILTPFVLERTVSAPVALGAVIETTAAFEVAEMLAADRVVSALMAVVIELARIVGVVSPGATVYCKLFCPPDREAFMTVTLILSPVVGTPPMVRVFLTILVAVSVPLELPLTVTLPI